ncbi:type VI secretion system tip protein VgrG, partial [Pseudomonas sp. MAFF212428]|nr:type VI secretion system tip protein VgrG [Pseudomonas brassicae]
AKGHRLIHTDRVLGLGQIGPDHDCAVIYAGSAGGDQALPAITRFDYTEQVRTARQVQRDYTFTHPRYNQQHEAVGRDLQRQSGTYERYDFPGRYKRDAAGKPFTQTRLLALRNDARVAVAVGDDARLQPGLGFDLHEHPREAFNTHWRTISIEHHGIQHSSQEEDAGETTLGTRYTQTAHLIDGRADWKAAVLHKPRIDGPQTATVVGPPGEEIYCDEWGRVKLSFPWDRESQHNDTSSCWVRVAQGWAGTSWGAMAIPRIGQEVIVSYLDGDADQPLVIGRTFRAANLPPYKLPLHKTRMTIKSQSHKGNGFNELRFEDELGQEEVFIHAQRDQNIVVKHDQATRVGNDRSDHVEQDEKIHVGRDRSEVVGNDEHIRIGQDSSLTVGRNQTLTVEKDRSESVGNNRHDRTTANHTLETGGNVESIVQGQYRLEVGKAIEHCAERILLQASHSLVLEGPGGSLCIDASGITLNGVAIHLKGPVDMTSAGRGATLIATGSPNIAQAMDQICGRRADGTCFREPCNCAARGAS